MSIHPLWMSFFFLFGLALPIGIIALIVWAIRSRPAYPHAPPPVARAETPLDILARRFAAGEISAEDYQKARALLQDEKPKSP